jgi:DNA-3-methyladenine glycosylase II
MSSVDHPYITHLKKDKRLFSILDNHAPFVLKKKRNICLDLCASIMSQQLSTKVAETIFKRFLLLFEHSDPKPSEILAIEYQQLRSIGLSNAKASYIHNVANFAIEKGMTNRKLNAMSNEEVIGYLSEIKGVGRWTVEMLLIFTLGREDVFAVDDFGIQQSMARLYRIEHLPIKELKQKMIKISEKWIPYRTYACLHLWNYKDTAK